MSMEMPKNNFEIRPVEDLELEKKIKSLLRTKEAVMEFLDSIDGIQGANKYFKSEELRELVEGVLNEEMESDCLPRTGGFRDYVEDTQFLESLSLKKNE